MTNAFRYRLGNFNSYYYAYISSGRLFVSRFCFNELHWDFVSYGFLNNLWVAVENLVTKCSTSLPFFFSPCYSEYALVVNKFFWTIYLVFNGFFLFISTYINIHLSCITRPLTSKPRRSSKTTVAFLILEKRMMILINYYIELNYIIAETTGLQKKKELSNRLTGKLYAYFFFIIIIIICVFAYLSLICAPPSSSLFSLPSFSILSILIQNW